MESAGFRVAYADRHFENSPFTRFRRMWRNALLAVMLNLVFRATLGLLGMAELRAEARLPVGSLGLIVARKKS